MTNYNPFEKELQKIHIEDLDILKEISEGWFIEYKQEFLNNSKIAKSIASFANTNGGYYIIGIKENRVGKNLYENDLIGFDLKNIQKPVEKMRDIIKSNITPIPNFDIKLIEKSDDVGFLLVQIREGIEPPYLTRDGKIYRRVQAGSDPIPETDRYSIQKLFEKGEKYLDYLDEFSKNSFIMSENQEDKNETFAEIYLYTNYKSFQFENFHSNTFLDNLIQKARNKQALFDNSSNQGVSFRFKNIQTSWSSYILKNNFSDYYSLKIDMMVELFENGNIKILIPIPLLDKSNIDSKYFSGVDNIDFIKLLNGYEFFLILFGITKFYKDFLVENNYFEDSLTARIKLTNLWRKVLFFDTNEYFDIVEKYGLPVILKDEVNIPNFSTQVGLRLDSKKPEWQLLNGILQTLGINLEMFRTVCIDGLDKYLQKRNQQ